MKREGWQHGVVRISRHKLLRTSSDAGAGDGESPAAAAAAAEVCLRGKAPWKPTNASKSTGKCRRARCASCHYHPVTKAKDKAKGAHKLRACDVALNHRLASWRVVDAAAGGGGGAKGYAGFSATAVLGYLAGGNSWHQDDDDDEAGDTGSAVLEHPAYGTVFDFIVGCSSRAKEQEGSHGQELEAVEANLVDTNDMTIGTNDTDAEEQEDDEEDDFYIVRIAIEYSDDEDWLVVEEV